MCVWGGEGSRIELDATSKRITSKRDEIAMADHLGWEGFGGVDHQGYCNKRLKGLSHLSTWNFQGNSEIDSFIDGAGKASVICTCCHPGRSRPL